MFNDKKKEWELTEIPCYDENAIYRQGITEAEIRSLEVIENIKRDIFDFTDNVERPDDLQITSKTKLYERFYDLRRNGKLRRKVRKLIDSKKENG